MTVRKGEARDRADDKMLKHCESPLPLNDSTAMISFSLVWGHFHKLTFYVFAVTK